MPKSATLKPTLRKARKAKGLHAWVVNVPKHLSSTGEREELFFATQAEAKNKCELLKTQQHNFGVTLLSPVRVAEASEAYKLLGPLKVSLLDAVRAHIATVTARTASISFGAAFDQFAGLKAHKSPKYRQEIRQARATFEPLIDRMICDVTAPELESLLSGLPNASRNAKMRRLRSVFNLAIKRGWMNPGTSPMARMDFADGSSKEVQTYSARQVESMFRTALENDVALIPFLTLGCFCGIRPHGELEKLEWSEVKLADEKPQVVIRPEISKTRRRRFVDLSPNALEWIEAYRSVGGKLEGKIVPFSAMTLRRKRRANFKATKIAQIQDGMRHTYCSCWLALHRDANELVLQSGHDSADTLWRHYHKGTEEEEARRFWAIRPPNRAPNVISMVGLEARSVVNLNNYSLH